MFSTIGRTVAEDTQNVLTDLETKSLIKTRRETIDVCRKSKDYQTEIAQIFKEKIFNRDVTATAIERNTMGIRV
ncbi:hypothetical protein [Leptospira noguchii]|uniref:hypothetical protein n=1 Tax=Leptospira noguchii TaxID=28182 RepID=UPI003D71B4B9